MARGRAGSCYSDRSGKGQLCWDQRGQQPLGPEPSSKWVHGMALNTGPALYFILWSSFLEQQLGRKGSAKISVQPREGHLHPPTFGKTVPSPSRLPS